MSVRSQARRRAAVTDAAPAHVVPNAMPPCLTLGQDMLTSMAWISSRSDRRSATATAAVKLQAQCEVSLENMMACGLGACLCCVEKTVRGNVCVCTRD